MLQLDGSRDYIFYMGPTDMRKSFDSLSGIVTGHMQSNALSASVYIFLNRRHTQLKMLQWEGDGFSIYYKRLEKGTYSMPVSEDSNCCKRISFQQLTMILEGKSRKGNYRNKRYQHPA